MYIMQTIFFPHHNVKTKFLARQSRGSEVVGRDQKSKAGACINNAWDLTVLTVFQNGANNGLFHLLNIFFWKKKKLTQIKSDSAIRLENPIGREKKREISLVKPGIESDFCTESH